MFNIFYPVVFMLLSYQLRLYDCASSKYLVDFINDLQEQSLNQNETQCVKMVINLLNSVQNDTLWATWVWDSMTTEPVGYLSGRQYQLGQYDQCLNPPWLESHPQFRTQYCLVHVKPKGSILAPERTGAIISPYAATHTYTHIPRLYSRDPTSIYMGLCLPSSCDTAFIEIFTSVLLKFNHFGNNFSETSITVDMCHLAGGSKPFSLENYFFIVAFFTLVILTVTSTYVCKIDSNSRGGEIARAFSISSNFEELTKSHPEELDALNGLRFIATFTTVITHQFMCFLIGPTLNPLKYEKILTGPHRLFTFGLTFAVDVFFVMSGLLCVKSMMTALNKSQSLNPIKLILKRYLRLAPLLAVALCVFNVVLEASESGPMGFIADTLLEQCRRNWWISLLMINNYIGEVCYQSSWSVPSDFHMTVLAIGLVYLYSRQRRAGIIAFAVVFALALVLPAVSTYVYDLPAISQFRIEHIKDFFADEYFLTFYVKSHNRFGPYLVGMILGYVTSIYKPNAYRNAISKSASIAGAVLSIGLMCAVTMLCGFMTTEVSVSRNEEMFFAAVHRTLFGTGFALLVVCLIYGTLPLLNDFLSWRVFRPLSRLSYGIYMVHFTLIMKRLSGSRVFIDITLVQMTIDGCGTIVISAILAFIAWFLVEAPFHHLSNVWLKSNKSPHVTKEPAKLD